MVARLTLLATLLAACTTSSPDVEATSPLGTSTDDSDDYSAWFEGLATADIEDFERQDDADQLAYPTPIPEPDHDPRPGEDAFRTAVGSGSDTLDAGVDAGPDAGRDAGPDAGVDPDASLADAGVDLDAGTPDAGTPDAGVDAGPACPTFSASASVSLGVDFDVAVRDQFLGTFGPVREHNIWARARAIGTGNLTLAGSITSTASSWSVTIAVDGAASATVHVHADQELVSRRRRQWFAVGDATLTGSVTFSDRVTFSQTCDPPGVVATTPGTPAIGVDVRIVDADFYGYFFPRLQGPVVTRIRGAIAQFLRNFANRQLPGLLAPKVLAANQAYAAKKQELLAALVAKLPAGCGCPVRN